MSELTINDVLPPTQRAYRVGVIQVPRGSLDISIDKTDMQGKLRDTGVFAELHKMLLLPASYSIFGVFYRPWLLCWEVCIESDDLPVVPEGEEAPEMVPIYTRLSHEDGTSSTHLKEIRIEQRWQKTYFPGEMTVDDL